MLRVNRAVKNMIRSFALTDLDPLLKIERQSFPKSPYSWKTFIHLYWTYPTTFWVYVDPSAGPGKEELCGYLIISGDGHLISLAVLPKYRRRGIGERLIRKAMETLSVKRMWAEVRRSNRGALAFYQKIGFRVVGVLSNFYGEEDALIAQWTPAPSHEFH